MKGILGRKLGMTQVFTVDGNLIPVTVIEVKPNVVLQKKTKETDGYEALQLGYEDVKESRSTKPAIGHAKKAGTGPKKFLREFPADTEMNFNVGDETTAPCRPSRTAPRGTSAISDHWRQTAAITAL